MELSCRLLQGIPRAKFLLESRTREGPFPVSVLCEYARDKVVSRVVPKRGTLRTEPFYPSQLVVMIYTKEHGRISNPRGTIKRQPADSDLGWWLEEGNAPQSMNNLAPH